MYRSLFGMLGGYVAARLGGARQAAILGVIGTVLGTLGLAESWVRFGTRSRWSW